MYICFITLLSCSMIQQTFIFLLSTYFVLPFELIPQGRKIRCSLGLALRTNSFDSPCCDFYSITIFMIVPNVYCPEFRRNSSKKFNETVNVKCDQKDSDLENWNDHNLRLLEVAQYEELGLDPMLQGKMYQ